MEWDYEDGLEIIMKAIEKNQEQRHWETWKLLYPNMTEKTFVTYEDFYNKAKPNKQESSKNQSKPQSKEEIMTMVEKIRLADLESRKEREVGD